MYNISLGISSVDNLDLDFTSSPTLTWSPPSFYSDDIPQGSVTRYHVYVKSKDGSVIVDVNTTDTFYQLPSNLTVCGSYNVSLKAFVKQYSSLLTKFTKQITGSKITLNVYCML